MNTVNYWRKIKKNTPQNSEKKDTFLEFCKWYEKLGGKISNEKIDFVTEKFL